MKYLSHFQIVLLGIFLLLAGACGAQDEPVEVEPTVTTAPVEVEPSTVPEPIVSPTLVHEFEEGTQLVSQGGGGLPRNPVLVAIGEQFKWGALVSRDGEIMWTVDGVVTPIGSEGVSDFVASTDLSRYAYVANSVVVVDGEQVEQGSTSCCPTFSQDGTTVGYIADGSIVVIDGVPQESMGNIAEQLLLSADGSRYAYIVDGSSVVLDGEKQETYDRVFSPTFSPDGSGFAYLANEDLLVVEGEETGIEENTAGQVVFSRDGSHLAYVKGTLKYGQVVIDENVQQRYTFGCPEVFLRWSCMAFISGGSTVAYTTPVMSPQGVGGSSRLTYRVIQDGVQGRPFIGCCLTGSMEGSHVAYVSSLFKLLVDGNEMESVAASITDSRLIFAYENRLDLPGGLLAADLVFSASGEKLGFLLHETEVDFSSDSITRVHVEILDLP